MAAFADVGAVNRVVVFGDSLSDVGTYALAAGSQGGKFTTNPGALWIELVAEKLKVPMAAYVHEGFSKPVEKVGGFNFAQGGARISVNYGSTANFTARPLSEQLKNFLAENKEFTAGDLVFIQGAANDVTAQLFLVKTGKIKPQQAVDNIAGVAKEFISLIKDIQKAKALRIVALNLPMIDETPALHGLDPMIKMLVWQMVDTFNQALAANMAGLKTPDVKAVGTKSLDLKLVDTNILLIDINSFEKKFNQKFVNYGFKNITESACKTASLPQRSSLYCNSSTLVNSGANKNYKFADDKHPTTGFSKIVADFIWLKLQLNFKF